MTNTVRISTNGDAGEFLPALNKIPTEIAGTQTIQDLLNVFKQHDDHDNALLEKAQTVLQGADAVIKEQEQKIAELEKLTTTDSLTGINNRRGLYNAFAAEMDRCERGLSCGGVLLMIDLDKFKYINDTYGHSAGDASLRLVAKTLFNCIRPMDSVARLGGDEFAVLMCNTSREKIVDRAQKLTKQLNNLSFVQDGTEIAIHASIGISVYKHGDDVNAIFDKADMAMYADKQERRSAEKKLKDKEKVTV